MVLRNYGSEECSERVPLCFILHDFDSVIQIGDIELGSPLRNSIAMETLECSGIQVHRVYSTTLKQRTDYIARCETMLDKSDMLYEKSKRLLNKIKRN